MARLHLALVGQHRALANVYNTISNGNHAEERAMQVLRDTHKTRKTSMVVRLSAADVTRNILRYHTPKTEDCQDDTHHAIEAHLGNTPLQCRV